MSQAISEHLIRQFSYRVDWSLISEYQDLSENFIREFQCKVNWEKIMAYQQLSEYFIQELKCQKLLAPCSLTKVLLTSESNIAASRWIDFPEPLAKKILRYKSTLQNLQLTFLDGKPDNLAEIGRCFEELETEFEKLHSK